MSNEHLTHFGGADKRKMVSISAIPGGTNNLIHILISWVIFSTFFWIAAYYKPFHCDEFYSWVYAERCSFKEILMLKDFGIGHPPLYHLIQKAVQGIFATHHPMQVRFANYVIGSLFVLILVRVLSREKSIPLYYYGICSSAGLLDAFVFSRMWGLVCLSSLLLLWFGEKSVEKPRRRNVLLLILICFAGIISDYNFVLVIPYVILVLFFGRSYTGALTRVLLISLCGAWIFSTYIFFHSKGEDIYSIIMYLMGSGLAISNAIGVAVFGFSFNETFLGALLALMLLCWFDIAKPAVAREDKATMNIACLIIVFFIFLILSAVLVRNAILRPRYVSICLISAMVLMTWYTRRNRQGSISSTTVRSMAGIIGGILMLLCISPFFWRDLRFARYMVVLLPFILSLMYRTLSRRTIKGLSLVFFSSGLLYVASVRVGDYYPPPSFSRASPVIFQDDFAYSTQYLCKTGDTSWSPFIMDLSGFDKFCRVCKMGTNKIGFDNFLKVWIVAAYDFDPGKLLPPGLWQFRRNEVNLTRWDLLQLRFLTPIWRPVYYTASEYYRPSHTSSAESR
jgi:hypothetical protein